MQLRALIVDAFRYTRDRKLFWVMLALSLFIAGAMSLVSFDESGATLLFTWHLDGPEYRAGSDLQRAFVAFVLTQNLIANYIGFAGVIIGLISTAGILPDLMRSGAIDVVVAKPMSRAKLFFGSYLGAMSFVFVQSAFFVTLTFLVAGIRWKQWLWPYFWSIPLSVILFSYVYAFCAFFAVNLRTTLAPLLLSLACWFGCFLAQSSSTVVHSLPGLRDNPAAVRYAEIARWAVPRTQDIPRIAGRLIDPGIASKVLDRLTSEDEDIQTRENMRPMVEAGKKDFEEFNMAASLASSLGIEALILLIAAWRFSRRDF